MDGGTQVLVFILSFAVFGGSGTQVSVQSEIIVLVLMVSSANFLLTGAIITTTVHMTTVWPHQQWIAEVEVEVDKAVVSEHLGEIIDLGIVNNEVLYSRYFNNFNFQFLRARRN
jgi:hypothetical protein